MKIEWNSKYKTIAAYTVITATVIAVILLLLWNLPAVGGAIGTLFSILAPFVVGAALAYLLYRPAGFIEKKWFAWVEKRKPHPAARRGLSIFTLFVIVFGVIVMLLYFVLPQLVASITMLAQNLPGYLDSMNAAVTDWLHSAGLSSAETSAQLDNFKDSFLNFTDLLDRFITNLPTVLSSVGTGLFNFFVGIIVCVYFLYSKEKFKRQAKKVTYAVFKRGYAERFMDVLRYTNDVFLGFIIGASIDALFVGTATFVFMTAASLPYAVLIAVIIGVTNIIPFFGPFLGAIPSAIILLIVNPMYAVVFVIWIVVLQQIDGNIVMPKLVGHNIGLSAFWVLFALILAGGLFGFWGLLLGVPVFAVVYSLAAAAINSSLEKKGVPPEKYIYPRDVIVAADGKTFSQRRAERQAKKKGS